MSGPAFVRLYSSDWRSGCIGLDLEEEGLYVRACAFQWETGRRLPIDDREAASALMLDVRMYRRVRDRLITKGKLHAAHDGYYNSRAEFEYRRANGQAETKTADVGSARRSDDQERANGRGQVQGRRATRPECLTDFNETSDGHQADFAETSSRLRTDLCQNIEQNQRPFKEPIPNLEVKKEELPPSVPLRRQLPREARPNDRGSRLDPNWTLPDEWRDWARTNCPTSTAQSVQDQADAFLDFWIAKPGKDGRKANWEATWRNWCRRSFAGAPVRPRAGTSTYSPPRRVSMQDLANAYLKLEDSGAIQ